MPTPLSELVQFVGEETDLVARVQETVEWLAEKPEGREALEEAYALHKKPITFVVGSQFEETGFEVREDGPTICANPDLLEQAILLGAQGEHIPFTLKRFIAHEVKHATQEGTAEADKEYTAHRTQLEAGLLPEPPTKPYLRRIAAAGKNPTKLREIFGEMYDTHVAPHFEKAWKRREEILAGDAKTQAFVERFEKPAIEFENLIMGKYAGEPARTLDYIRSDYNGAAINASLARERYIKRELAARDPSFRKAVVEAATTLGQEVSAILLRHRRLQEGDSPG